MAQLLKGGARADGPANVRVPGFGPPAIKLRQIQATVHQHFHAAGATRFPRVARGIQPDVNALNHLIGHTKIVVLDKHDLALHFRAPGKGFPAPDQFLAGAVVGVGLARQNDLERPVPVGQQRQQSFRVFQQQIRPLVLRKPACEAKCQGFVIKQQATGSGPVVGRVLFAVLARQALAQVMNESGALSQSHGPKLLVGDLRQRGVLLQRSTPPVLTTGPRPDIVRLRGVPARGMNAIGNVINRHVFRWPARKARLQNGLRHLAVNPADPIDATTEVQGEPRHIQAVAIAAQAIGSAEGQQPLGGQAVSVQPGLEVELDELLREPVKSGRDGGVGGKQVGGAGCHTRGVKVAVVLVGPLKRPLHQGQGTMAFVDVADRRVPAKLFEQAPAANAQHHLLL